MQERWGFTESDGQPRGDWASGTLPVSRPSWV
jgi:hypothetical protein